MVGKACGGVRVLLGRARGDCPVPKSATIARRGTSEFNALRLPESPVSA